MKEKKRNFLHCFLILFYVVLILAFTASLVSSVLSVIHDVQTKPVQRQMNQKALFDTVRQNADMILADIERDDFSRTLTLFDE